MEVFKSNFSTADEYDIFCDNIYAGNVVENVKQEILY